MNTDSASASDAVSDILSAAVRAEIDRCVRKFPDEQSRSAVLGALTAAQHHNQGYLTVPLMDAIADYLQLPKIAVYEVASFYSLYETKPVGRQRISVCTNISCMLRGSEQILQAVQQRLGIDLDQSTADGKFFLKREEECLAACCAAPVMQINHRYYENLTPTKVETILAELEQDD